MYSYGLILKYKVDLYRAAVICLYFAVSILQHRFHLFNIYIFFSYCCHLYSLSLSIHLQYSIYVVISFVCLFVYLFISFLYFPLPASTAPLSSLPVPPMIFPFLFLLLFISLCFFLLERHYSYSVTCSLFVPRPVFPSRVRKVG